jgi:hypothetical protein
MRYFRYGEHLYLLALVPDAYGALVAWVHNANDSITREHMKLDADPNFLTLYNEVEKEAEARRIDPLLFGECLDKPYKGYPTMIAFYEARYQEQLGAT